jgi:hypothetical protein
MKELTEQDYIDAANKIGCEVAIIKAVAEVESGGGGFIKGSPKILFEAHQFYKRTPTPCNDESICVSSWSEARKLYRGGLKEYPRLLLAMSYDAEAALESASWGKFQIMGFNFYRCYYQTVEDFVQDMFKTEREHLKAFLNFIDSTGLKQAMIDKDWAKFAKGYNGASYKVNKYDERLERAYIKYSQRR